jgi:hypothetical protein
LYIILLQLVSIKFPSMRKINLLRIIIFFPILVKGQERDWLPALEVIHHEKEEIESIIYYLL